MIGMLAKWDKRYEVEHSMNRAIDIHEDNILDQKSMVATDGSIFSKEFGFDLQQTDLKEYSCPCGASHGGHSVGHTCKYCGGIIKPHFGRDILRFGWVDLGEYKIILPNVYEMIRSVVGKHLVDILNYKRLINKDGNIISYQEKFGVSTDKFEVFNNIGMVQFQRDFVKIITYFMNIRGKTNVNIINTGNFLIEKYQANELFASKYPIPSPLMRPAYVSGGRSKDKKTFAFVGVNKFYVNILNMNKSLNRHTKHNSGLSTFSDKALTILYRIQLEVNNIADFYIHNNLSGKSKDIRGKALGKRLYYSSRMVIKSLSGKYNKLDGIVISYKAFLECFKPFIINMMMKGFGSTEFANWTVAESLTYMKKVEASNNINKPIYDIMNILVSRFDNGRGIPVMINRNPSMGGDSLQQVKLLGVTPDATDKTMGIQLTSCPGFNADFDGDVLNMYLIIEKSLIEAFKAFNPKHCLIDKTGGSYLNTNFSITKDRVTSLFSFLDPVVNQPKGSDYKLTLKPKQKIYLPHEFDNVVLSTHLKKTDFDDDVHIDPDIIQDKYLSTFRHKFNTKLTKFT